MRRVRVEVWTVDELGRLVFGIGEDFVDIVEFVGVAV